jgi:serine/threonine protein kinase
MSEQALAEESIFLEAVQIESDVDRAAYLDRACRDHSELRADVEALLFAHDKKSRFLLDPLLPGYTVEDELRLFNADEGEAQRLTGVVSGHGAAQDTTKLLAKQFEEVAHSSEKCADETPAALAGQFGRYRIVRTLGCGAMGTVYLAEDSELRRQVALKTPNVKDDKSAEFLERLYREARSAATLRHANICPVFDIGQIDGTHYISMGYIQGHPLSHEIQSTSPQAERQVLTLISKLARALQEAHEHGVVHRDLKPSNIMVDNKGEPIIMDFGLAYQIRHEEDIRLTRDGVLVGTPAFMSPEQVEGVSDKIGPPTDQYSLGVIFYELLTGDLPFRGTVTAVIHQISTKEPEPPSRLRPTLDPRIEAVCLKMMAKQQQDRFDSLEAVAEELEAILRAPVMNPIEQREPTRTLHVGRPSAKQPRVVLTTVTVCVVLVLVLVAIGTVWRFGRPLPVATGVTEGNQTEQSLPAKAKPLSAVDYGSPLSGAINVRVWDPVNPSRRGLSLTEPSALPLRQGDQIRVEASVDRPAYLYLIWVGSDGKALPVYPWKAGDWSARVGAEHQTAALSLPERIDGGWELEGGPGMETLVLLAREQPFPEGTAIRDFFADLPAQRLQSNRAIVWLNHGEVARDRSPKFFDVKELNDPMLRTQRLLAERLKPHFPLIRAVSFANQSR